MDKFESLNHTAWVCKYHVVFIPKCRRKTLYVQLRQYLGEVFRKLAANALRRRVGGDQVRKLFLELLEFCIESIVLAVGNLRLGLDIIQVVVVVDELTQLGGAVGEGRFTGASLSALLRGSASAASPE